MTEHQFVTITVHRARNLAAADSNGFSDPYAVLVIGHHKKRTKTIKKTLNPEWNQSFTMSLDSNKLIVNVFDWDATSSDDFLGTIQIDLNSYAKDGVEHWFVLGQRKEKGGEKVSGEICLSFHHGIGHAEGKKHSPSALLDKIKSQIALATQGGDELDLLGCELNKLPNVVIETLGGIKSLNLGFNNFVSFPEIPTFVNLIVLDLTGNKITNISSTVSTLSILKELHMNGNLLNEVPDDIGKLTQLEKLHLSNNRIGRISKEIGRLVRLEELSLTGNLITEVPNTIGCCQSIEVLDLSACKLVELPGEFTYMTKLMELNLATNELKELPHSIGRMTRLVILNVADNKLTDLPLSLGYCVGLAKFGAGINIERNPISNPEMLKKFKIGPDHMVDFLEKRLQLAGEVQLEEYVLPSFDKVKANSTTSGHQWGAQRAQVLSASKETNTNHSKETKLTTSVEKQVQDMRISSSEVSVTSPSQVDEKLKVLKQWGLNTIISELRVKLSDLIIRVTTTQDTNETVVVANIVKSLRPEVDKAKQLIPVFEVPKSTVPQTAARIEQVKGVVLAAIGEVSLTLNGIYNSLDSAHNSKEVIALVQCIKGMKLQMDQIL